MKEYVYYVIQIVSKIHVIQPMVNVQNVQIIIISIQRILQSVYHVMTNVKQENGNLVNPIADHEHRG